MISLVVKDDGFHVLRVIIELLKLVQGIRNLSFRHSLNLDGTWSFCERQFFHKNFFLLFRLPCYPQDNQKAQNHNKNESAFHFDFTAFRFSVSFGFAEALLRFQP